MSSRENPRLTAMRSAAPNWLGMSYGNSPGGRDVPGPLRTLAPSGTRDIASIPHPMPTSTAPAVTRFATKLLACCDEPHWQSTVVHAVSYGSPDDSHALRVTLLPCSPACVTQPPTTCSTIDASTPARFTTSICTAARISAGCSPDSNPLRFPIGVRTASTMTASGMSPPRCRFLVGTTALVTHGIRVPRHDEDGFSPDMGTTCPRHARR
jgi:hypothetical protein